HALEPLVPAGGALGHRAAGAEVSVQGAIGVVPGQFPRETIHDSPRKDDLAVGLHGQRPGLIAGAAKVGMHHPPGPEGRVERAVGIETREEEILARGWAGGGDPGGTRNQDFAVALHSHGVGLGSELDGEFGGRRTPVAEAGIYGAIRVKSSYSNYL